MSDNLDTPLYDKRYREAIEMQKQVRERSAQSEPALDQSVRCDACRGHAVYEILTRQAGTLTLCYHDYNQNREALSNAGAQVVVDDSSFL